jgi:hypothetical protein
MPAWLRSNVFALAVYVALSLVCFGSLMRGGFLVDDWWWAGIVRNGSWPTLNGQHLFFRPLASIVFVFFFRSFGPNPTAFHLFGLALAVISAYATRAVWMRLNDARTGTGAALLAGCLYLIWPTHAEAMGWISCFSDLLVGAAGMVALWGYLDYITDRRVGSLCLSLLGVVVALLSKESAVVLPLIIVTLGWACEKRSRVVKPIGLSGPVVVAIAVTIVYVLIRAATLRNWVAGYGHDGPSSFLAAFLGTKLTVNLANAFFPFSRYLVGFYGGHGLAWIRPLVLALILGALGAMLRFPGRRTPLSGRGKRAVLAFFVCTLFWWVWTNIGMEAEGMVSFVFDQGILIKIAFLIAVFSLLGLLTRIAIRNWARFPTLLHDRYVPWVWIPAGIVTAEIVEHSDLVALADGVQQLVLLLAFLGIVYITRPLRPDDRVDEQRIGLRKTAGALLFASVLALLPSVTLPIGFDGQQSRFSYLGSLFAVLFLLSAGHYVLRTRQQRLYSASAVVVLLFAAQAPMVGEWARAGQVSRLMTRHIVPHSAPTTYVVAAPSTYGAALLFLGGLESIPLVMTGTKGALVIPLILVDNMVPGDEILCKRVGPETFLVSVSASASMRMLGLNSRLSDSHVPLETAAGPNGVGTLIKIVGFKPGDHVLYVGTDGPHEL